MFLPRPAPTRIAVELATPSGERDTSFEGYVQLQLHLGNAAKDPSVPHYKVRCYLGLCLWTNLRLEGPPGQHRLEARVVDALAPASFGDATSGEQPPRTVLSAPIVFKERLPLASSEQEAPSSVEEGAEAGGFLRSARTREINAGLVTMY